jgi:hypothetical protein
VLGRVVTVSRRWRWGWYDGGVKKSKIGNFKFETQGAAEIEEGRMMESVLS